MSADGRWEAWLDDRAEARRAAGLERRLRPRSDRAGGIDLAGNDYLGLARHPRVTAAAAQAAQRWGAGAAASRLVTGTLGVHAELEAALADYLGQPAALVLSTGYHANLAVVAALGGRDAVVVSDAHVHASLVDAARLSRSEVRVVPHNDVAAVDAALAAAGRARALVLAESVYSVLGDQAPLRELAEVCARHQALLVVDEAHGLGVRGAGVVAELGLAGRPHVVVTATLSKALGSQGGAVLGPQSVVDHLVNHGRPFVFDTGLAPAAAGAALAALAELREHPDLTDVVRRRAAEVAAVVGVGPVAGAVVSVPMPSPQAALAAQAAAAERGVLVGCFRPPSTPDGVSRLRITVSAGVGDDDWARAVAMLREVVAQSAAT